MPLISTIARERGTRWQDTPLPGERPAPEPKYGRWQDAELPGGDEVRIQPVPDRVEFHDEVRIQPIKDEDRKGPPVRHRKGPGYGAIPEDNDFEIDPGFMDFYNRQKSPIYDGRGNVTGYNHGYGERETFDTPIPRDQYTGPGHEMGESRLIPRPKRRERAFDVRDTWRTPRPSRGISTSSTRNLDDRGIMTDRMRYYRR